jgi:3-dehydroquinate dehydratase-2
MVTKSRKIILIEGPNLNLVEQRELIYKSKQLLEDIISMISELFVIEYFQSNSEGEIIDKIQEIYKREDVVGIIINPGAYTHYSIAISDALEIIQNKIKVEVHLTNLYKREKYRQVSFTAKNVDFIISGAGNYGYYLAAKYIDYKLR